MSAAKIIIKNAGDPDTVVYNVKKGAIAGPVHINLTKFEEAGFILHLHAVSDGEKCSIYEVDEESNDKREMAITVNTVSAMGIQYWTCCTIVAPMGGQSVI